MKKLISLFLIVLFFCNSAIIPVSALDGLDDNLPIEGDLIVSIEDYEKCKDRIEILNETRGLELTLSSVKQLLDFAGNTYYAIECDPVGYAIMHGETGEVVEYAENAPSPYAEYTGTLFYGGATYYYVLDGGEYKHVWYNETLSDENISDAAKLSAELNSEIIITAAKKTETQSTVAPMVTNTLITNGSILEDLRSESDMGYMDGGVCGYVASGLMLLWHRHNDNSPELIDGFSYLYDNESRFICENFTRKLRSFGAANGTSADGTGADEAICDVLTRYGNSINANFSSSIRTLPSKAQILYLLRNKQQPVMIFGALKKTSSASSEKHAVLAYGYTSNDDIIVHYGHKDYSKVNLIYTALGQYLYLDYSINQMSFSDIPSTNWAYEGAAYCARYGIIDESSGTTFGIDNGMTRGMFVNALYHLCGEPSVDEADITDTAEQFTDFSENYAYSDALAWAYTSGIMNGTTTTTISPHNIIERCQAVTFLYRFNSIMNYYFADTSGPIATSFDDRDFIEDYAYTAMNWATRRYIIQGIGNNLLDPKGTMTKAACAKMIFNFTQVAEY